MQPQEINPSDVFTKTSELADKIGANQVCKQAAVTDASNFSTSAGASGSVSGFGVGAEAEAHAQASSAFAHNSMEQSGCGTLVLSAQKILNNSKKIQCIMQKSSQSSEVDVGLNASIRIITTPLTAQEMADKAAAIKNFQDNNKLIDYIQMLKMTALPGEKIDLTEASNSFNSQVKAVGDAYSRNINMEGVNIGQTISGKIKVSQKLSSQDAAKIETLSKQIASTTAQAIIEQKAGLNALSPNIKQITDTTSETNENLSSTSINSKVQSTKTTIKMNAELLITAPGSLNMKNVNINQNIVADIIADSIVTSAVDAGIKSASEIISNSSIMNSLKAESKGVDDLVKAQGEANAAAINAAKIVQNGANGSIFGAILLLAFFYISKDNPALQMYLNIIIGVFVFFIVAFLFFFGSKIAWQIRKYMGTETYEDKEQTLKRPLKLYNNYWKTYGCTAELELSDILEWDELGDIDLKNAMQYKYNLAIKDGASDIDINSCFADGVIPILMFKVKLKKPADLSNDELKFLWTKSKCNDSDFDKLLNKDIYKTMLSVDDIIKSMKTCKP